MSVDSSIGPLTHANYMRGLQWAPFLEWQQLIEQYGKFHYTRNQKEFKGPQSYSHPTCMRKTPELIGIRGSSTAFNWSWIDQHISQFGQLATVLYKWCHSWARLLLLPSCGGIHQLPRPSTHEVRLSLSLQYRPAVWHWLGDFGSRLPERKSSATEDLKMHKLLNGKSKGHHICQSRPKYAAKSKPTPAMPPFHVAQIDRQQKQK